MIATKPYPDSAEGVEEAVVRMRDCVGLATDLYLPPGTGSFPTLLTRTPYGKTDRESMLAWIGRCVNDRGYAFVAQDCRGKGHSEGEPNAFVDDARDAYDTSEWLSRQSWCNGRIGLWGESYTGFTAWAAVSSRHPAIRAFVSRGTSSFVDSGWFYRQGLFELFFAALWSAENFAGRERYDVRPEHLDWNARPLADLLSASAGVHDSVNFRRWQAARERDPFWTDGIYRAPVPSLHVGVPGLHVGGWWDLFRHGQLLDWALARETSAAPQFLVMNSTDHGGIDWTLEPPGVPDPQSWTESDIAARLPDYLADTLDFYDEFLKGRSRRHPDVVRWRLTHVDWFQERAWPPQGTRCVDFHLTGTSGSENSGHPAGGLSERPDHGVRWIDWIHDPKALVPTSESLPGYFLLADPPDDRHVESRPDVLSFTSDPFRVPLDLAGPMLAELRLSSSCASMHVIVRLLDVMPDGRTRRICDGGALVTSEQYDAVAAVSLGHTGYRVQPHHRLRLHVASSDFPRYLPHPGTDESPWAAIRTEANRQRLKVGGASGSRLSLMARDPQGVAATTTATT